jgi:hemoglobin
VSSLYEIVGEDGITSLVAAFYARVPNNPVLSNTYPADDLEGAEQRLRDFLVYRFGGPQRYIEERGHPRLRRRHAAFAIDASAREEWMHVMNEAFVEASLPDEVTSTLRAFFAETSAFLVNREDEGAGG